MLKTQIATTLHSLNKLEILNNEYAIQQTDEKNELIKITSTTNQFIKQCITISATYSDYHWSIRDYVWCINQRYDN